MTESDVLVAIAYAEGSWGKAIPQTAQRVWQVQLADLPLPSVRSAIDSLAAVSDFVPTPQHVRAIVLERANEIPDFAEVYEELVENATTCDFFDPDPPRTMTPAAQALGRSIGWPEFRSSDQNTYFVHELRARYAEVVGRAARRLRDGLPAFDAPEQLSLEGEVEDLVEGIGAPPPKSLWTKYRKRFGLAAPGAIENPFRPQVTVQVGAALEDPLSAAERAERQREFDAIVARVEEAAAERAEKRKADAKEAWEDREEEPEGSGGGK
jgi:hypothetical protein